MDYVPVAEAGIALPAQETLVGRAVAAHLLRSRGKRGNGSSSRLLPRSGRFGLGQYEGERSVRFPAVATRNRTVGYPPGAEVALAWVAVCGRSTLEKAGATSRHRHTHCADDRSRHIPDVCTGTGLCKRLCTLSFFHAAVDRDGESRPLPCPIDRGPSWAIMPPTTIIRPP